MRRFVLLFVLCYWIGLAVAADPTPVLPDYRVYVDELLDHPALSGSSWSVLLYSVDGDSIVYQRDPDRRLVPASVAKLVTSAAAIDALGPDYRFTTRLVSSHSIDGDGHLRGDLIVQAGGDPTIDAKYVDSLRAPLLRSWADSLRALGLTKIEGNIVLRTWPYRLQVSCPEWEVGDVNDRFGPSVDGFGFHSNVCQLAILPGSSVGSSALLSMDPPYAPVELRSSITTSSADTAPWVSFRLVPEEPVVYLTGEVPLGDDGEYLWLSIQDPARYFGNALREALLTSGIEVAGDVIVDRASPPDADDRVLIGHQSQPLSEVMKLMNKESDNYVSEYVLRALGVGLYQQGDLRSGLNTEERFLRELAIDEQCISLRDGCGLSRQNLCSARGLVSLLKAMYVHPSVESYLQTMSISGVDGTIAFRMNTPELTGKVFAKTGTISHVANLAGYMYDAGGHAIIFAILCNNFPSNHRQHVRVTQDNILERLYSHTARQLSTSRP